MAALCGPLVVGISGFELTSDEREVLNHPLVSGVILFSRNYQNPEQLCQLTASIHALRDPKLLITVDQEGGRVQRFRSPFTELPAAGKIGRIYDQNPSLGLELAEVCGEIMAMELRACGIDLSFAPVLDIDNGHSKVIGDRGFHSDPKIVAELAISYVKGMGLAGMKAVGKHYPGHGSVINDTHLESAVDPRSLDEIKQHDLVPFAELAKEGIAAMMAAHVIYPKVDLHPAGFSKTWLHNVLRQQLGFKGIIFSDDLGMMAAKQFGSAVKTVEAALEAGCDRVLLCNEPDMVLEVINGLEGAYTGLSNDILMPNASRNYQWSTLKDQHFWQDLHTKVQKYF